jgi:hypothetical protein
VFPPNDLLAEWVAIVAMAMNDCTFHATIVFGEHPPGEKSYAARAAVAHLYEFGKFLEGSADLPEVQEFLATLGGDALEHLAVLRDTYRDHRSQLEAIRSCRMGAGLSP